MFATFSKTTQVIKYSKGSREVAKLVLSGGAIIIARSKLQNDVDALLKQASTVREICSRCICPENDTS